jgi:hypothetical protein
MTKAKKPNHTLQPTPVRSAIRNILFIVFFSRTDVESNVSFIESVSFVESRISSPIATVRSLSRFTLPLKPAICSSFCDSSSDSTASEYWPLEFGVALRNPPTPGPPPLLDEG